MNPWKGLTDLPKNVWLIVTASLINRVGTMVLPFLALYLTQKMGESAASAGMVIMFYGLGSFLSGPVSGKLSDVIGQLRVIKISFFLSGVVLLAYSFIRDYQLLLLFTFTWAFVNEGFRPANRSLIADIVTPAQRRPAFALNRLSVNLGMSIGPVVAGFLVMVDFSIIFYVDAATSILAGIFLILAPWDKIETSHNSDHGKAAEIAARKKFGVLKDRRFLYFMLALLPVPIVYLQHQSTMPLFLVRYLGFAESTFGLLFTINTVLIILIEVPLNNSMKAFSDKALLAIGALLCGIGFGAMAFVHDIYGVAITIVIWTFGEMIIFPASAAYMAELAPKGKSGQYMGVFQMVFSLAFTIGPWAGTLVLQNYGPAVLWSGTFVFCALSAMMMLRLKTNEGPEPA